MLEDQSAECYIIRNVKLVRALFATKLIDDFFQESDKESDNELITTFIVIRWQLAGSVDELGEF